MTWCKRNVLALLFSIAVLLTVLTTFGDSLHLLREHLPVFAYVFALWWSLLLDYGFATMLVLLPLLAVLSAWICVFLRRHVEPFGPASLVALAFATVLAAVSAGTYVYFLPLHGTLPMGNPEDRIFAYITELSLVGIIGGVFARVRRGPRWLFWMVEAVSVWLFLLGAMPV